MSEPYRPDIDGLRAVSVASVLAFHAGLPFAPGGFVGVDVFFVISGYLISKLLLTEYEHTGRISVLNFWSRRVRRLAPALLFVVAVVLLASTFLLQRISGEIGELAWGALATLLVSANHFFLRQSKDYFGFSAESNPLLHMWSLSVEEQFYLVWPLLLIFALTHGGVARSRLMTILILSASFVLSCYWTVTDSSTAFYLMPTRAWEMLAGATLAFAAMSGRMQAGQTASALMALGGVIAIGVSVVFISGQTNFPSPAGALPVGGAMLVLAAGSFGGGGCISRVLGSVPMAYVGKISYPLYLWHWPILVVMRSNRLYEKSIGLDLLGLLIAFVLAIMTFEVVEKRSWRHLRQLSAKHVLLVGLVGSAVVFCMALLMGAWTRFGWGYSSNELRLVAARKDMPKLDCMFSVGTPGKASVDACFPISPQPSVLLLGDSHANHWRPAIEHAAERIGLSAATLTKNACIPPDETCVEFDRFVANNLPLWRSDRGLVGVVMSRRWPEGTGTLTTSIAERARWKPGEFFDKRARSQLEALAYLESDLRLALTSATDLGLKVLLVLPSPVQKFSAPHCLSVLLEPKCRVTEAELKPYLGPAEDVVRRVAAEFDMVRLVEPRNFLCRKGVCPVVIDGTIVYTDDDHVSKSFSTMASKEFEAGLAWLSSR